MRTNMPFDEAWRELQSARRGEDINELLSAINRLQRAARLIRLEQQQQAEEDQVLPLGQKPHQKTH